MLKHTSAIVFPRCVRHFSVAHGHGLALLFHYSTAGCSKQ
jgi:hypothetical protein